MEPSLVDTTLKSKYPAKAHCQRVAKYLTDRGLPRDAVIYLESQVTEMVEDDDQAKYFRQRRYFFYLSGCKLPDSYLTYSIPDDHCEYSQPHILSSRPRQLHSIPRI